VCVYESNLLFVVLCRRRRRRRRRRHGIIHNMYIYIIIHYT